MNFLLLAFLVVQGMANPTSETLDFRFISQDLLSSSHQFSEPGVTSYSQLLFDISRNQMFVGARDTLYRLSLRNLKVLEKAHWPASPNKTSLCLEKGQSEEDCHNHIKVLLADGKYLFSCGTGAFSPECSWREIDNISKVEEWLKGIAKCPFSPKSNITALLTMEGHYFVGSPMDFSGTDSAISRSMSEATLRTNQFNSKWLNNPDFVGSFEADKFVYFIFRETAVEYINCGKVVYSRIARVCKNDTGGQLMLKDNWTTFVKARLNCSIPGEYPFYFNEVQGTYYLEKEGLIYATFTTPSNGISGSAICVFNMTAISMAFSGPFKHQDKPSSTWERRYVPHKSILECQSSPHLHQILDVSLYQLMDSAVQPFSLNPLYVKELETLTHIAVDVVATSLHRSVHVLYVATTRGLIKKISVLPHTMETCVVEVWKPLESNAFSPIKALHFLKETKSVYIGSDATVMQIKVQHCSRFRSMTACLNAMDPYCGWNNVKEVCSEAPDGDPSVTYWLQNSTQCPVLTDPVDGGWSGWSAWTPCFNQDDIGASPDQDKCMCSTRQCNNPPPQNGGLPCQGMSIRVTNCTRHGSWTAWSAWSACSQTCGTAVKTKRRTCGNPAPAHGGRVCVGPDRSEIYCASNPPCPVLKPPPRDGQWGEWGDWNACSKACGRGFRVRHRVCDSPLPENGGQECQGCLSDYDTCNVHPCPEGKKYSSWTPWVRVNNSATSNGYVERRYRFICRAPVDAAEIRISPSKEEERVCYSNTNCLKTEGSTETDEKWSHWSSWTSCSSTCGSGMQYRTRVCLSADMCDGLSQMSRQCNTHECEDLQGWGPWTEWSICDVDNMQHRQRQCQVTETDPISCQGVSIESRMCTNNDEDERVSTSSPNRNIEAASSVPAIAGSCVTGLAVGIILTSLICFYMFRHQRKRIPGSPHYISSKQNPYVTVPLREVGSHTRRTPSTSTTCSNGGGRTLGRGPVKLFTKSSDYDSATAKRNSHCLANDQMRADLDQEKFF